MQEQIKGAFDIFDSDSSGIAFTYIYIYIYMYIYIYGGFSLVSID